MCTTTCSFSRACRIRSFDNNHPFVDSAIGVLFRLPRKRHYEVHHVCPFPVFVLYRGRCCSTVSGRSLTVPYGQRTPAVFVPETMRHPFFHHSLHTRMQIYTSIYIYLPVHCSADLLPSRVIISHVNATLSHSGRTTEERRPNTRRVEHSKRPTISTSKVFSVVRS